MPDHKPQTVDGGNSYRPRSIVHRLFLAACLSLLLFSSCQFGQPTVTLALLGDINLGRGVTPSVDSLAYLTSHLSAADLALANLESPLANYPPAAVSGDGYDLCVLGPPTGLLADWGLDLLSIANNHRFDCGPEGPSETVSLLTNAGLTPVGFTTEPVLLEVNGLSLAFFAFDDVSAPLDSDAAAQSIRDASESGALVIVSVHWGAEYQGGPSKRQQALAQQFADAGASVIWGHHPHVLQPAKWVDSTLVLYSLGNALFDQGGLSDTRRSALVLVTLDADGMTSVQAVPFEIDVVHSRVVEPDAETAEKIHDRINIP